MICFNEKNPDNLIGNFKTAAHSESSFRRGSSSTELSSMVIQITFRYSSRLFMKELIKQKPETDRNSFSLQQ